MSAPLGVPTLRDSASDQSQTVRGLPGVILPGFWSLGGARVFVLLPSGFPVLVVGVAGPGFVRRVALVAFAGVPGFVGLGRAGFWFAGSLAGFCPLRVRIRRVLRSGLVAHSAPGFAGLATRRRAGSHAGVRRSVDGHRGSCPCSPRTDRAVRVAGAVCVGVRLVGVLAGEGSAEAGEASPGGLEWPGLPFAGDARGVPFGWPAECRPVFGSCFWFGFWFGFGIRLSLASPDRGSRPRWDRRSPWRGRSGGRGRGSFGPSRRRPGPGRVPAPGARDRTELRAAWLPVRAAGLLPVRRARLARVARLRPVLGGPDSGGRARPGPIAVLAAGAAASAFSSSLASLSGGNCGCLVVAGLSVGGFGGAGVPGLRVRRRAFPPGLALRRVVVTGTGLLVVGRRGGFGRPGVVLPGVGRGSASRPRPSPSGPAR